MKKIISLFLLSVYFAFIAGTLVSATDNAGFFYHSSEFKGKYLSSSDDGLSSFAEQPANAKKVQKQLPFTGKVKLTRPGFSNDVSSSLSLTRLSASRLNRAISVKPEYSSVSLYLRNRMLLI
jgi:hypothetical protein